MNENSLKNLKPFPKGKSGNPLGKPKGAVSVKARLKKMFREEPEKFEEFVDRYLKNEKNERHLVEMLDGKPAQTIDAKVDTTVTILFDEAFKEE